MPTTNMSPSGGKAEIPDTPHQCPLLTHDRRQFRVGGRANRLRAVHRKQLGRSSLPAWCKPRWLLDFGPWADITSITMRSCVGHRPLEFATTTGKPVHSRARSRNVITIVPTGPILL